MKISSWDCVPWSKRNLIGVKRSPWTDICYDNIASCSYLSSNFNHRVSCAAWDDTLPIVVNVSSRFFSCCYWVNHALFMRVLFVWYPKRQEGWITLFCGELCEGSFPANYVRRLPERCPTSYIKWVLLEEYVIEYLTSLIFQDGCKAIYRKSSKTKVVHETALKTKRESNTRKIIDYVNQGINNRMRVSTVPKIRERNWSFPDVWMVMEDACPSKALLFWSFQLNQETERGIKVICLVLMYCIQMPCAVRNLGTDLLKSCPHTKRQTKTAYDSHYLPWIK